MPLLESTWTGHYRIFASICICVFNINRLVSIPNVQSKRERGTHPQNDPGGFKLKTRVQHLIMLCYGSHIWEKRTCWSELLNENVKHRVVCDDDDDHETIKQSFPRFSKFSKIFQGFPRSWAKAVCRYQAWIGLQSGAEAALLTWF